MPPETIIRSRQNPIYKQMRSLLRRDRRHQERAFLVEGPRFILDAMATGAVPSLVAVSESFAMGDYSPLPVLNTRVFANELFETLTDTVTSQGAVAVFPFPSIRPAENRVPLVLIADGIQDPGNLGTLIRSAAGAGATQVVTLPGTTDPWAPKTVRAAAASHFLIPIVTVPPNELLLLLSDDCKLFAADAAGATCYDECDLSQPMALVIGSEGSGLSTGVKAMHPTLISIRLSSGLESLNAAVAGSVILFEASRQRASQQDTTKVPGFG